MEWKIFSIEWIWNGKNFAVWNMEKSSSIPFHSMPWTSAGCMQSRRLWWKAECYELYVNALLFTDIKIKEC